MGRTLATACEPGAVPRPTRDEGQIPRQDSDRCHRRQVTRVHDVARGMVDDLEAGLRLASPAIRLLGDGTEKGVLLPGDQARSSGAEHQRREIGTPSLEVAQQRQPRSNVFVLDRRRSGGVHDAPGAIPQPVLTRTGLGVLVQREPEHLPSMHRQQISGSQEGLDETDGRDFAVIRVTAFPVGLQNGSRRVERHVLLTSPVAESCRDRLVPRR